MSLCVCNTIAHGREEAWRLMGERGAKFYGELAHSYSYMWVLKSLWIFNVLNLSDSSKMGTIDFSVLCSNTPQLPRLHSCECQCPPTRTIENKITKQGF